MPHKSESRLRTERLQERTFTWAKEVIDLCPRRYQDDPSRAMWRQLLRAASSASANLDEADEASSDDEFVYKMQVVLREAKEAKRWLQFIVHCRLQHHDKLASLPDEAGQLVRIFATIVRNTKRRLADERRMEARAIPRSRPRNVEDY